MSLDVRTSQTTLENLLRDVILFALGQRLPQQATIAVLRAFPTQGASGPALDNDTLITTASPASNWRFNRASVAPDNGTSVIQPADVAAGRPGRWMLVVSAVRFAPVVGGNSQTIDSITSGPLVRIQVLDKPLNQDEVAALTQGDVPIVTVEAHGDDPTDPVLDVGARWNTTYDFTITVISQNLRDYREAAQGSTLDGDPGANAIDGWIQSLLGGTALNRAFTNDEPIMNVRVGHAENRFSDLGQRRVWRSRDYAVVASVENPPAPNDTTVPTDVTAQAELVALNQQPKYDPNNYLVSGCLPTVGGALAQSISAGSALIAGITVTYAGQSFTFVAYSDTYRDLNPNGTLTLTRVTVGGEPPALAAGALRIGVTTTNGTMVVGDALIAQTQADFGPQFDFPIS